MWQIMNGVDKETSMNTTLGERCLFLEACVCIAMPGADSVSNVENLPRDKPRLIQTHLPFELLPPQILEKAKVIYVSRNPKDACVSWYYHTLTMNEGHYGFIGTFQDIAKLFRKGATLNGDYFNHIKGAWMRKYHPNLKFLWYEDMKRDLVPVIKDLCNFTNYPLTAEKIMKLEDMMVIDKFREMHANPQKTEEQKNMRRQFIRKGEIGDWKNHFSQDMSKDWDEWIAENLSGTNITLQFE